MSQVPQAIGVGDLKRKRVPIWVLLLALAVSMPLALQGATQYVAHQYGYHASLGEPVIGDFYWPWSFIVWSLKWGHTHTELFQWA